MSHPSPRRVPTPAAPQPGPGGRRWCAAAIVTLVWSFALAAAILARRWPHSPPGVGLWWARESYRTLGHAMDADVLFARHGVIVRHSETVDRDEPIGLRVRQSVFARRAGVASMDVALVARGFTRISDMDAADIESLAVALLGPLRAERVHDDALARRARR